MEDFNTKADQIEVPLMQLALKSDASLDSAYLNEPSKCRSIICWNAVMVFCPFRGFLQRNPGSPEAKDVWMLNLSNFARYQLATYLLERSWYNSTKLAEQNWVCVLVPGSESLHLTKFGSFPADKFPKLIHIDILLIFSCHLASFPPSIPMWGREARCHSGHRSIREVPPWQGAGGEKNPAAKRCGWALWLLLQVRKVVLKCTNCENVEEAPLKNFNHPFEFQDYYFLSSSKNLQSWFSAKWLPASQLVCCCLFASSFCAESWLWEEGILCTRFQWRLALLQRTFLRPAREMLSALGWKLKKCCSCTLIARHVFKYSRGKHIFFGVLNSSDMVECDFAEEPWEVPSKLICLSTQFMKRQGELWLLTWPAHTFSVMLLFCNRNDRNLVTLENRFYHVILASNIGNHTCLEHYAGIRGIVLRVHHPRHSTPQDLYNSSTNICVCALYVLICIIQCRITKIYIHYRYMIYIYIYVHASHCLWDNVSQKIPKTTASSNRL